MACRQCFSPVRPYGFSINMAFDQCRFAECLGKYEAIWNVKAKDHGNKEKRKAQLQALADEFGISVELAETKYTSLRTYFVKQRRKVKESQKNGCGPGDIYRPSWPPYSALTFLEKTLDLQNTADVTPDSSMRLSMVDTVRTTLPDDMGLVTMVEPAGSVMQGTTGRSAAGDVRSPVPEVNTIILSMPDNVSLPIPDCVASPLPESTMRIPMPGSMRLPIKTEDKEPALQLERFPERVGVQRIDDSPPTSTSSRLENNPPPHSSNSPRIPHSVFPSLPASSAPLLPSLPTFSYTLRPSTDSSTPSPSIALSSLPLTFPHSHSAALPSSLPHPAKLRKRSVPKPDESQIGVILQDAVDSLRTITGNYRDESNDDVSGFLKMTGYQLRSIQDPIQRMRLMHAIQGLILNELSSSLSKQSEEVTAKKYPEETGSATFSS